MISVCMATYNGERFIKLQLESILRQLPIDAEVVVSDDGSTDRTLEVIASFGDPRIQVLAPSEKNSAVHLGPVYNFERALQASKGGLIFLADQDDVWLPGKVLALQDALGYDGSSFREKTPWLAVHDALFIDSAGNALSAKSEKNIFSTGTMWTERPCVSGMFCNWLKNSFTGCCMAFRRELLDKALPFPKKLPMHDQWLGILAEKYGSVVAVKEPLIQYRLHENNATHLVGGKSAGFVQRIRWRLNLLINLLKR